jgi:LuxR family maltose regulon positive regulatory protein
MERNLVAAARLGRQAAAAERDPTRHRYGIAHAMWATALFWLGKPSEARDAIDGVLDEVRTPFVQLLAWGMLAAACLEVGEVERAERTARMAVATAGERHSGPAPELAMAYLALGGALIDLGDLRDASAALALGIDLSEAWNAPPQAAYGKLLQARLHAVTGDATEARRLIGDAEPIVESARVPGTLEAASRRARAALHTSATRTPTGTPVELTVREYDILRLLESRLSQRAIGASLGITRNTVKSYTQSLYRKLGVSSREDAIEQGRRLRLI